MTRAVAVPAEPVPVSSASPLPSTIASKLRVLVACEYSATVRDAFLRLGFNAYSCDLLPTEARAWRHKHYQANALDVAYGEPWDLMIAHPPCQYLSYAGAGSWNNPGRAESREEALAFFKNLYNAPIPHIAIENPRGFASKAFRRQDQEVNPFQFGEPHRKRICLWLKNLPHLIPTEVVEAPARVEYIRKTGARAGQIYRGYFHQGKSAHARARFFPGVADAMARQWGTYLLHRDCPACDGSGRCGPYFPGGISTLCGNRPQASERIAA